jgi:hypothetical protein
MGQCSDFIMSEGHDAVSGHRPRHLVRPFRVLQGLAGMFVPSLMFLLPVFLTGAVGVCGEVMQLGCPLMIFVMRSVVISSGHNYSVTIWPDLACASFASL